MSGLTTAAVAAAVVLMSAPLVRVGLRRAHVVDIPSARSSHEKETTRGGGIAVALGCTLAAAESTQLVGSARAGLLLVALGMGLIGLLDDLRSVEPLPRLGAQIAVAAAAAGLLCHSIHGPWVWRIVFPFGVLFWIVSYVNVFNFMDGINGISVAQVLVAGAAWWGLGVYQHVPVLAAAGAIVAAAGMAFIPFNVPRALMFLGDVGSYFLGGWLAATAVMGLRSGLPYEAILAPLALYCVDTSSTLIRRIRRGEAWSRPHREHVYQRLVQAGWSHHQTSLVVGVASALCAGLGALSIAGSVALRVGGDALIAAILVAYVMNPITHRRRAETRPHPASPA